MKEQEIKAVNEIADVLIDNKGKMLIEVAIALYNAGYRKQEWISVDDRLPKEQDADADYGVLAIHKRSIKRYFHWKSVADNPFDFTHWMPLPQPPKMKGGAE